MSSKLVSVDFVYPMTTGKTRGLNRGAEFFFSQFNEYCEPSEKWPKFSSSSIYTFRGKAIYWTHCELCTVLYYFKQDQKSTRCDISYVFPYFPVLPDFKMFLDFPDFEMFLDFPVFSDFIAFIVLFWTLP